MKMLGFNNNIDNGALEREERELRELMSSLGAENSSGPSDAYWNMFPQRVMARVRREEVKSQRVVLLGWWKPAVSLTVMATAVVAFVALHPAPLTLDQVTASLSDQDIQVVEQAQNGVVPISSDEQAIASDIANQVVVQSVKSDSTDIDAMLTIEDVDPNQVADEPQPELPLADQSTIESLNDQETDAVIQSLKTSL